MSSFTERLKVRNRHTTLRDSGRWVNPGTIQLPFGTSFSLAPLLAYWRNALKDGDEAAAAIVSVVEEELKHYPWLGEPIEDLAKLGGHEVFLSRLMRFLHAPADALAAAVVPPFQFRPVYTSASFQELLDEEGAIGGRLNLDVQSLKYYKTVTAYLHLSRALLGVEIPFRYPAILEKTDTVTGLKRYYKLLSDYRFISVEVPEKARNISEEARNRILTDPTNLEIWEEIIPSRSIHVSGFEIIRAVDVTDEQILSFLKEDFLEYRSRGFSSFFPVLARRLKEFLRKPELEVGICALRGDRIYQLQCEDTAGNCLFLDSRSCTLGSLEGSLIERSIREGSMQAIDDLSAFSDLSEKEKEMRDSGVRNIVAAPLFYDGELIGLLYLWAYQPAYLTRLDLIKLLEILPQCAAAAQQSREELWNRIRAVILEQYTAIHPSVEWRFKKAAMDFIRRQEENDEAEPEPIVFEDVYPLYAAADIRASSLYRNQAVQYDLIDHLNEVVDVLQIVRKHKPLPIIDHLIVSVLEYRSSLENGLSSGDEGSIKDFIQRNIEPLFEHFRSFDSDVNERVNKYWAALDMDRGSLYWRCRDYDESVERINHTITSYLTAEERKAQSMFPHYFEKHETDGVEFSIYVGASLVEDGIFNPIYVKNLRLWQLMVLCGIARRVEPLKKSLKVPLEVTYLLLAQSSPLSIRFQLDETRFDVEGTYDIRYEIMKRRIDKAVLKERGERLTQPGKIAIVYSQHREAGEYREYIRFLQNAGYLEDEVEELEIEDLQGITGLKALRVTVNLESGDSSDGFSAEEIEHAVQDMPVETG